jgi:hypothetical protein
LRAATPTRRLMLLTATPIADLLFGFLQNSGQIKKNSVKSSWNNRLSFFF